MTNLLRPLVSLALGTNFTNANYQIILNEGMFILITAFLSLSKYTSVTTAMYWLSCHSNILLMGNLLIDKCTFFVLGFGHIRPTFSKVLQNCDFLL